METSIVPLHNVPTRPEAEEIIKQLVSLSKIKFSAHARRRMQERGITTPQIINCLQKGSIVEGPFPSFQNGGGYQASIKRFVAGEELKVVVCMKYSQSLLIITVINL